MLKAVFVRSLPVGAKFTGSEGVEYKVVRPGTETVLCRDSVFNLPWNIKGDLVVKADPLKLRV